jgi:hypothetical protein
MSKTFNNSILSVRDAEGNIIDIPAIKGKSAYEYAQDGGYMGTEEDFAEMLAGDALPDYWEEYLPNKIADIKAAQDEGGKDSFSYVVLTDMHYPSNLAKRAPTLAKKIMDECNIKYVLILGDTRTRGVKSTKEECEAEWDNIEKMLEPLHGKILMTQGNHDAGYGRGDYDGDGDNDTYAYEYTPAEMFNRVYRRAGLLNAHYDNSGTAFYVDDVSAKVRYILLNTQLNFNGNEGYSSYETVDGMAKYPSMWKFRYTQCQYDFLINDALTTVPDDEWGVIIGSHCPINQSGEMPEYAVMVGVLNAYNNKTTYTGEYEGMASGGSAPIPNFTNKVDTADADFQDDKLLTVSAVNDKTGCFISNYITAQCAGKNADIIRISGIDTTQPINAEFCNSSKSKLGFVSSTSYPGVDFVIGDDGVVTWKVGFTNNYISTANANALSYFRISATKASGVEDIVITVNEEITYTESGGGDNGSGYDAVSVDCDFSNSKGTLICYNAGHTHQDKISTSCYPSGALTFPIITTRCDAKEENTDALKAERVAGTTTEQSFDVFTVNKKTKTIHATKIGAGSDRTINY